MDIQVTEEMEATVRETVRKTMPDAVEFAVSVIPGPDGNGDTKRGLLDLLLWALNGRRCSVRFPEPATGNLDPFFMFGTS